MAARADGIISSFPDDPRMAEAKQIGQPIDVYRNLGRECLSVKSRITDSYGLVIDHVDQIVVNDASFVVQESSRQRVVDEERKNVHAYVRGIWAKTDEWDPTNEPIEVTYNPYQYDSFVECGTERPLDAAQQVYLRPDETSTPEDMSYEVLAAGVEYKNS